ncbi:MAG TPA: DUF962 domain-containing protein [Deltaproteobacteria bacterium]|nr:MAG: permease [Deltaproteobacteria bacterium GWA2_45_12]HBF13012.1 DUF962 domain-containing protein [Deltaproteobacteria bacterium]
MNFVEDYNQIHQNPVNRALHMVGIPAVLLSLPLFFWDWRWALGLFSVGWIFQFVGHAFEGKPPAFFSHPAYLIAGIGWWFRKVFRIKN